MTRARALRAAVVATIVAGIVVAAIGARRARADVGILQVGGDASVSLEQKRSFAGAIAHALQGHSKALEKSCRVEAPVDTKCLEDAVAGNRDIDEVAAASLSRGASGTHVTLKVITAGDWKEVLSLASDIAPGHEIEGAEELCVRAFDPAHYVGTISVEGAPPSSIVYVDGLRAGDTKSVVSVGSHAVTVEKAADGAPLFAQNVEVGFRTDKLVVVHVAAEPSPSLAPYATLAVTVAGAAAIGVGIALEAGDVHGPSGIDGSDRSDFWRTKRSDVFTFLTNDDDPKHNQWGDAYGPRVNGAKSGPTVPARFAMTAVATEQSQALEAVEASAFALMAAGGVVLIAGAVSTTLLFGQQAAE